MNEEYEPTYEDMIYEWDCIEKERRELIDALYDAESEQDNLPF